MGTIARGQRPRDVALGRFLSLVLRHQPSAAHLTLDEHGWADVNQLIAGCCRAGKQLDRGDLERIVRENQKQRYCFNEDHTKIRANQGHSIHVDVELKELEPPAILYHGTSTRFLHSIQHAGITPQSRQYVHLSSDRNTALQVGNRHGIPVVLAVDAAAMRLKGFIFYRSENGVWLCREVPWQYITVDPTQ